MSCCVPHCASSTSKPAENERVTHHQIPSDPDQRASLLQAVNRYNWMPSDYSTVCSLELSATAQIGGYITRVVNEHMACLSCSFNTTKPKTNSHLQGLTKQLNRGGPMYPLDEQIICSTFSKCLRQMCYHAT